MVGLCPRMSHQETDQPAGDPWGLEAGDSGKEELDISVYKRKFQGERYGFEFFGMSIECHVAYRFLELQP